MFNSTQALAETVIPPLACERSSQAIECPEQPDHRGRRRIIRADPSPDHPCGDSLRQKFRVRRRVLRAVKGQKSRTQIRMRDSGRPTAGARCCRKIERGD